MQIFLWPIFSPEKVFVVQPSHFCKNLVLQVRNPKDSLVRGPIGNRFVDLSETGSWTYRKPVRGRGPIRNRFLELCINRFVGAKYFYLTKPKIEIPLLTEIAHWLNLLNIRFCGFQMSKTSKPFIRLGWNFFQTWTFSSIFISCMHTFFQLLLAKNFKIKKMDKRRFFNDRILNIHLTKIL